MVRTVYLKVIPKNSLNLFDMSEIGFPQSKADFNEE